MKKEFLTHSATETADLGKRLGALINKKSVIAFQGGMGSGKTCFTTGFVKGLDYFGEVNSPTFALVNEYIGGRLPIYHFDMYRIADEYELFSVGFYDYLDEESVLVIEWSENIADSLPEDTITVTFSNQVENKRTITIQTDDENLLKEL